MSRPLTSRAYFDGVYIPAALIIVGIAIIKREWLPYAIAAAVGLGGWKFSSMQPKKILHPKEWQEFELQEKTIVSHNVAIYRFQLPSPSSILGLPIGQHVSIGAALAKPDELVQRSYTPISSDNEKGYFDLLVKSYPKGNISKYLAELQVGQAVKFRGPKGAMVYQPNMVRHFGMIAGGTGITPMLQIIRAVIRGRPRNGGTDRTKLDLIFANVTQKDILLKDDLDALVAEDEDFNVHYVLNEAPEGWKGGVGFVTDQMIKDRLPAPAKDIKILICGPPPMVNAMKKATEGLGYDPAAKYGSKLPDQVFCF